MFKGICRRAAGASLAVTVTAALAITAASPAAAAGGVGIRLLDIPVSAGSDSRARVYIVDHLAPGTTIHRRIEVANHSDAAAHVSLYPAAASIIKGTFVGAAAHTRNDLSTWTSVDPASPDIAAGGTAISTVTIAVPKDAAPGEQYGVIWAEVRSAAASSKGVVQVSRVGIRIYLSVGPGGAPAPNFTIDSLTAERGSDGAAVVLASVHNTGGRALDMNGSLSLTKGPGGLNAGPFAASLGTTLAIGDVEPVRITLDKRLPAGPWSARITLRSGLIERSAQADITFPAAGAAPASKTKATGSSKTSNGIYYAIGGLVLLLLILAGVYFFIRSRRHRPGSPDHEEPVKPLVTL